MSHAQSPLCLMVSRDSSESIRTLIQTGSVDVHERGEDGSTLLSTAAARGDPEIIKILLEAGIQPNRVAHNGVSPLLAAAQCGRLEAVKALLAAGALVNHKTKTQQNTALLVAAKNGHAEVVALLIAAGADINHTRFTDAASAILLAARGQHYAIVDLLFKNGADPTASIQAACNDPKVLVTFFKSPYFNVKKISCTLKKSILNLMKMCHAELCNREPFSLPTLKEKNDFYMRFGRIAGDAWFTKLSLEHDALTASRYEGLQSFAREMRNPASNLHQFFMKRRAPRCLSPAPKVARQALAFAQAIANTPETLGLASLSLD